MRLSDYLSRVEWPADDGGEPIVGETETDFAIRAGLPQKTVNNICRGTMPRGPTALAIIEASENHPTPGGETVSLADLVAA
jgi:hypothetical protein